MLFPVLLEEGGNLLVEWTMCEQVVRMVQCHEYTLNHGFFTHRPQFTGISRDASHQGTMRIACLFSIVFTLHFTQDTFQVVLLIEGIPCDNTDNTKWVCGHSKTDSKCCVGDNGEVSVCSMGDCTECNKANGQCESGCKGCSTCVQGYCFQHDVLGRRAGMGTCGSSGRCDCECVSYQGDEIMCVDRECGRTGSVICNCDK
mmetsp:Transcript_11408/g.42840  ORF Transcript_11408/g.42840 Transcript_11408/m.42840 type:complete len:201 (-) Transcript_11408:193-795(-)